MLKKVRQLQLLRYISHALSMIHFLSASNGTLAWVLRSVVSVRVLQSVCVELTRRLPTSVYNQR